MAWEKLAPEVRDAFRAYRYHKDQTGKLLPGATAREVSNIENNGRISPERVRQIIKGAWGFRSLDALLDVAKDMPQPPRELTQEVRDAVRAYRLHKNQTAVMLTGASASDISDIENDRSISPVKALKTITAAWGFKSFEELLEAAKDLPRPPRELTQEVRDAFRAFRHYTGQMPRMLTQVARTDIFNMENGGAVAPGKALNIIKAAWGFHSFEELLTAAKDLPQPPQVELTQQVRDAFRAYRHHTGLKSTMLPKELQPAVSYIGNDRPVSADRVLDIIYTAWKFNSFEELLDAARNLPQPPPRTSGRARGE